MGINTFLRPGTRGLYNLYIVDPSEQQIRAYSPAADGSGFPAKPTAWLATARDVAEMTSTLRRRRPLRRRWRRAGPLRRRQERGLGRPRPRRTASCDPRRTYSLIAAGAGPARRRDLRVRQGRTPGSWRSTRSTASTSPSTAWPAAPRTGRTCARCTSSRASTTEPSTLVWMSRDGVHQAILVAVPDSGPAASPSDIAGSVRPGRGDTEADQEALTRGRR